MIVSLSYLIIYKSNFYFFLGPSFLLLPGIKISSEKSHLEAIKKKNKIILSITRFSSLFPLVPSVSFYLSHSSFLSIRSRLKKKLYFLVTNVIKKRKKTRVN